MTTLELYRIGAGVPVAPRPSLLAVGGRALVALLLGCALPIAVLTTGLALIV